MKKLNSFILLLLFVCLFTSCEDEKVDIDHFGKLSGIVYDGETNQPIEGALVATSPASSSILTTSSGEFSFDKVFTGEVSVTARKKDYLNSTIIVSVFDNEMTQMNMVLQKDDKDYGSVAIFDPVPGNGSVDQYESFTMKWDVDQSKSDIVLSYDVYLFKSNSSIQTIVGESLIVKEVVVDNLDDNATYYWYVVAKYDGNIVAYGPTWSFKTGDNSN